MFGDRFTRASLGRFYRLLGAALACAVLIDAYDGQLAVQSGRLFPWRHLPPFPLVPVGVVVAAWIVQGAAGLLLLVGGGSGRAGRVAVRVGAGTVLFGLTQAYANQRALLFLVALFVALAPPDPADPALDETALPNLGLVRWQLPIVYLFSAANKLTAGFADGRTLGALADRIHDPLAPAGLVRALFTAHARATSIATIAAELALPAVLLVAPRAGLAGVALLHVAFALCMPAIWPFTITMIAMAVLFERPVAADPSSASDYLPRGS